MRKLQEDDVMDNMILSVDDIYTPAFQSDTVSGINDSSYNAFPTPPAYQGGFAEPTYKSTNPVYDTPQEVISVIDEEPIPFRPQPIYSTNPVYQPQPIAVIQEPVREEPPFRPQPYEPIYSTNPVYEPQPIAQEPVREEPVSSIKCLRVIFTANRGFSATAYWKDCSGVQKSKFISVNETLEVDALEGTASGLPFMSYPIGQSPVYEATPIVKSTNPVTDFPVEAPVMREVPIDPIFLLPVSEPTPEATPVATRVNSPAISPELTPDVPATPVVPSAPSSPAPTTETTLPTKTSKDLKPYIIAGIAVVALLIASRLFSKK